MLKKTVFQVMVVLMAVAACSPAAAFVEGICDDFSKTGELPVENRLTVLEGCLAAHSGMLLRVTRDAKANVDSIGELYANLNAAVSTAKAKHPDAIYKAEIDALKHDLGRKTLELKQLRTETEHVKAMFSFLFMALDQEAVDRFTDLYNNRDNRNHRISPEMTKRLELLKKMARNRP